MCGVQSNLLITSLVAKVSGQQDSLLHRSQARHAQKALSNIRLSCCGGAGIIPLVNSKHYVETIELLEDHHKLSDVKVSVIKNYLSRAQSGGLSSCMVCGFQLSTLLLMPCGDLICTECMTNTTAACLVCGSAFDTDEFQELQPGLDYTWRWNVEEEKKLRKARAALAQITTNTATRRDGDIRQDVGIAPAIWVGQQNDAVAALDHELMQDSDYDDDDDDDDSFEEEQQRRPNRAARRPKKGDGHTCVYSRARGDGVCILCKEEHDECIMKNVDSTCPVCHRVPEPCPEHETKFFHIVSELERFITASKSKKRLSAAAANIIGEAIEVKEERPPKVIIFSQFRTVLNLIGHRVLRRFGAGAVAEYWGSYRKQELRKFQLQRDCFCMLLGKDGSEGLDLSFVTHILFMEEVWDKSMENQTVARAWRMGATGEVHEQTLVARDTVEQMMAEMELKLSDTTSGRGMDDDEVEQNQRASMSEYQRAKLVHLLKNVKLIRPVAAHERRKPALSDKEPTGSKRKPQNDTTDAKNESEQDRPIRRGKRPKVRFGPLD